MRHPVNGGTAPMAQPAYLDDINASVALRQQTHCDMLRVDDYADRLEARKAIRAKLGELQTRNHRRAELQGAIARLDRESDDAVLKHHAETAPLQDELAQLEARQVEELLADKSGDPATESKLEKLRDQLAGANDALEASAERVRRRRLLLERELADPALSAAAENALENLLFQSGDPLLIDAHEVCLSSVRWAEQRRDVAAKRLREQRRWLTRGEQDRTILINRELYARRVRRWELELAEATKRLSAEQAMAEELRQRIIGEE